MRRKNVEFLSRNKKGRKERETNMIVVLVIRLLLVNAKARYLDKLTENISIKCAKILGHIYCINLKKKKPITTRTTITYTFNIRPKNINLDIPMFKCIGNMLYLHINHIQIRFIQR